jgi:hypothetical protein
MRKIVLALLVIFVLCVACAAMSLLSGKPTNPPITAQPKWDSPSTRELAQRACFDCHSNETYWPWYTNLPPFSLLIKRDVVEGRRTLNFSEWDRPQRALREGPGEVAGIVLEGEMPPLQYIILHPNSRLTDQEKQALAQGLQVSLGQ